MGYMLGGWGQNLGRGKALVGGGGMGCKLLPHYPVKRYYRLRAENL